VSTLTGAFWAEALKARRSKVPLLTVAAFLLFPIVDGLFMFILQDPARARDLGLIRAKAQLTAGAADWPTFFQVLLLGTAVGGAILYAFITAWVFGREFSDHTAKELLAVPTSRSVIVVAKLALIAVWTLGLAVLAYGVGLGVGRAVSIPGWSAGLAWSALGTLFAIAMLTYLLMPVVALLASAGRGYLPPLGWAFLTMGLGQIAIVTGWGDWFPWSVPGLLASLGEPRAQPVGFHSYGVVLVTFLAGSAATLAWWSRADHTR
jgi:ABC-2 type transport system permease protein